MRPNYCVTVTLTPIDGDTPEAPATGPPTSVDMVIPTGDLALPLKILLTRWFEPAISTLQSDARQRLDARG